MSKLREFIQAAVDEKPADAEAAFAEALSPKIDDILKKARELIGMQMLTKEAEGDEDEDEDDVEEVDLDDLTDEDVEEIVDAIVADLEDPDEEDEDEDEDEDEEEDELDEGKAELRAHLKKAVGDWVAKGNKIKELPPTHPKLKKKA